MNSNTLHGIRGLCFYVLLNAPWDITTFVSVAAVLGAAALLASFLPAPASRVCRSYDCITSRVVSRPRT